MKRTTIIFSSFLALLLMTLSSCGSDPILGVNDCNSSLEVNQAVADEVNGISIALQNWITDQSTANCNALETAYQNYIEALMDLQDCADQAGVGAEFSQALIQTQADITGLNC